VPLLHETGLLSLIALSCLSIGWRVRSELRITENQIASTSFSPVLGLKEITRALKQHHEQRMQVNQEFKFLTEDIQKLKASSAKKSTVLDLGKYVALQEQQQMDELKRLNLRRKLQGLGPVTAADAATKSDVDYVKDESLQITAELINRIN